MIKISKKISLVLLCVLMVLSAVPQVSAETGSYYTDDFNRYLTDASQLNYGYPGNIYNASGDVAVTSDVFYYDRQGAPRMVDIDADGGTDGTAAIVFSGFDKNNYADFRYDYLDSLTTDDIVVAKYDVRFASFPDVLGSAYTETINMSGCGNYGGYILGVSKKSGESAYFYPGKQGPAIDTSKWYTIVLELQPTEIVRNADTNAISSGKITRSISVIDETGTVIATNSASGLNITSYGKITTPMLVGNKSDGAKVYIDNASLLIYNPSAAPELISSNMTDGETDVLRNKELKFTFSQPVQSAPTLYLDGTPVSVKAAINANEVSLSLPDGGLFDKEATYTVDFSGVTNSGGMTCAASSLSFTTEGTNLLDDVALVGAVLGSGSVTAEFELADPHGYPSFSGYVIAAAYDENGILKDFTAETISCRVGETVSKTFTLSAMAGDSLQLVLFDTTKGISPLASGECNISAAE